MLVQSNKRKDVLIKSLILLILFFSHRNKQVKLIEFIDQSEYLDSLGPTAEALHCQATKLQPQNVNHDNLHMDIFRLQKEFSPRIQSIPTHTTQQWTQPTTA